MIAHRLSTIRDADEILVVDEASSSSAARTRSLLADDGLYAELYRTQFADQEEETETAGA